MNLSKLEKEGKKWVEKDIISEDQLDMILKSYPKKDANVLVILFAILLTGLAFLTFIFSDWAQVAHISRVIVLLLFTFGLYVLGDQLFSRKQVLYGVSFIMLGYVGFIASLFLVINNYEVMLFSGWPFIIITIVGLGLYVIYSHSLFYFVSLTALTIGQFYSEFTYNNYSYTLLIILIIGFGYFTFRHAHKYFAGFFGVNLVINLLILATSFTDYYYWFIVYMFVFYLIANLIPNKSLSHVFKLISLSSMFLFNVYQASFFEESFMSEDIKLSGLFLIVLFVLASFMIILKRLTFKTIDYIYLILFIPTIYLPFPTLLTLIILFVFSAALLIIGYKDERNQLITYGTLAFLLSTLTVYIQYAWDVMNKSLFFLIGGLILFGFSFMLEKNRRKIKQEEERL